MISDWRGRMCGLATRKQIVSKSASAAIQRHVMRWLGVLMLALFASLPATAATLPNGGKLSAAISTVGGVDNHTFTANAGDSIWLRIADMSSNSFAPNIVLYSPTGAFIGSDHGGSVAKLEYTATATGTYTVVVTDNTGLYTGNYDFYFTRVPGANENGALINGGIRQGTISLGDLNSYTFSASAGDSIWLRIADMSANSFAPYIVLYSPTGGYIGSDHGGSVAKLEYTAAVTGTYTVVVTDNTGLYTGNYDFYFTRVPGANENGALYDGETRTEAIELGDLDSYVFTASTGQSFQIDVTDTSGNSFAPYIVLYSPAGAYISSDHSSSVAKLGYTATTTGTYTVVVTDNTGLYTGNYSIVLSGAGGQNPGTGSGSDADVPLPLWALVLLAGLLGHGLRRGRNST